jgi:hypothetical protein
VDIASKIYISHDQQFYSPPYILEEFRLMNMVVPKWNPVCPCKGGRSDFEIVTHR